MNKTNLDQALAALADALKSEEPNSFLDNPKDFVKRIPHRSLTGDHINGGKIHNFASTGITDTATSEVLSISDEGVVIKKFAKGFLIQDVVHLEHVKSETVAAHEITCDIIKASQIIGEIEYANDAPITFKGDNIEGKGILWAGRSYTKQLIFASNPDRIFISESVDLGKGKNLSINNLKVLDETSLGTTITKSNLRELGRLNGLIVDGSASISEYFYFDGHTNRFGLGTAQPNAAISVIENDVEIVIGAKETAKGFIGTFNSQDLSIGTDNTARISISAGGNITLGNASSGPVQVNVLGKLTVNVNNPDPRTSLHVNGPIKFNNKLHMSGTSAPTDGSFTEGDIVWNSTPFAGQHVGWVCTRAGTPGLWNAFGRIE